MLPTVQECREFMAEINRVRVAYGLEPLGKLPFDKSHPSIPDACLSFNSLIGPVFGDERTGVGGRYFRVPTPEVAQELTHRSGWPKYPEDGKYEASSDKVAIPDAIIKVTDPFDYDEEGLRERLVEAGLVD